MFICFIFKEVRVGLRFLIVLKWKGPLLKELQVMGIVSVSLYALAQYLNLLNVIGFRQQKGNVFYNQNSQKEYERWDRVRKKI
jgi:hypothetical protein